MRLPEIAGNRRRTGISRHLLAGMIFACMLLAGTVRAQTPAPASGLEGTWAGVLGGQLHLIVTIKKSGDGGFEGTLNSVDQHATLAMSSITLKGDSVRFEVPRVGGLYEGNLNKSADAISGSWTQTGIMAQPLDLQRTAKPEETPTPVTAPPAHTPKPFLAAFNAVPSITPQAFKADGKWHLVYELHISNFDKWDYRFKIGRAHV